MMVRMRTRALCVLAAITLLSCPGTALCLEAQKENFPTLVLSLEGTSVENGCDVLGDVGFYRFEITPPEGKTINNETIVWTGPGGITPLTGSRQVTCNEFANTEMPYTIHVEAKPGGAQANPQAEEQKFMGEFQGKVYAPVFRFVQPADDEWWPQKGGVENKVRSVTVEASAKAQYGSGKVDITNATFDVRWRLPNADKTHFQFSSEDNVCDAEDTGPNPTETVKVMTNALMGEMHKPRVRFWIDTEKGVKAEFTEIECEKLIGAYGVDLDAAMPDLVGTDGNGEIKENILCSYEVVPSEYTGANGANQGWVEIFQNGQSLCAAPNLTITSNLCNATFTSDQIRDPGTYTARGKIHVLDPEKQSDSEGQDFVAFSARLVSPTYDIEYLPPGGTLDLTAEIIKPSELEGTLTWKQAPAKGTFSEDDELNTTFTAGSNAGQTEIWVEYEADGKMSESLRVAVHIVKIGLSAYGLSGAVSDDQETNPGAFVHYNLDNDNGNVVAGTTDPIGDDQEDGPVTNEDDLVQLSINLEGAPSELGRVILSRTNAKLRVWSASDKGSANEILKGDNSKSWDLSKTDERNHFNAVKNGLWVEGFDVGVSTLTVAYRDPSDASVCSDTVKYRLIACTCGRQPTPTERTEHHGWFPRLIDCEWSITAGASPYYNCFASTVGNTSAIIEWWDVDNHGDGDGVLERSDFDAFYADYGYVLTADPAEAVIALYKQAAQAGPQNPDGITHAAKKRVCGCGAGLWRVFESKIGKYGVRMEHRFSHLDDDATGGTYGSPYRYYKVP